MPKKKNCEGGEPCEKKAPPQKASKKDNPFKKKLTEKRFVPVGAPVSIYHEIRKGQVNRFSRDIMDFNDELEHHRRALQYINENFGEVPPMLMQHYQEMSEDVSEIPLQRRGRGRPKGSQDTQPRRRAPEMMRVSKNVEIAGQGSYDDEDRYDEDKDNKVS